MAEPSATPLLKLNPSGYSVFLNLSTGALLTFTGATTMIDYSTVSGVQVVTDYSMAPLGCDDTGTQFNRHMVDWKAELKSSPSSKFSQMLMSPHYQRIIGMGWKAVPYLLAECQARPDHWDWALKMITGENPVPEAAAGKIKEICRAWLDWGRGRRLV